MENTVKEFKFVNCDGFGGVEVLKFSTQPLSTLAPRTAHGVLFQIAATGVNRAEIMQRQGKYPPTKDGSSILGLEGAGYIVDSETLKPLRKGCTLLNGGGYAQYATVDERHVIELPADFDLIRAAAIPEAWITAYQTLRYIAKFAQGETALIYAGASGVGTAALQLAKFFGGRAIVTVSSEDKAEFCRKLGADLVINYKQTVDLAEQEKIVKEFTGGRGVDVVLDCVGAQNVPLTTAVFALDARWVLYGLLGGAIVKEPPFNFSALFAKRAQLLTTTLKSRTDDYKTALIAEFRKDVLPALLNGTLQTVVHSVQKIDWAQDESVEGVRAAHREMEANKNIGKIILDFGAKEGDVKQ